MVTPIWPPLASIHPYFRAKFQISGGSPRNFVYKPAGQFHCEFLNFATNFRSSEHFSEKLVEINCKPNTDPVLYQRTPSLKFELYILKTNLFSIPFSHYSGFIHAQ